MAQREFMGLVLPKALLPRSSCCPQQRVMQEPSPHLTRILREGWRLKQNLPGTSNAK